MIIHACHNLIFGLDNLYERNKVPGSYFAFAYRHFHIQLQDTMMLKVQVQDEDLWARPEFVDFFRFRLNRNDVTDTYRARGRLFVKASKAL